ncbi:MAG: DUF1194 domain-containing protein [Kiloniellales bacterium]|nr:DUF1194 domain-containing protein [Kiloniellales bacterium]
MNLISPESGHRRRLVTCVAILLIWAALPAQAAEPVHLELVLAADGSGSIDEEELRLQRAGYAQAITDPRVLDVMTAGGASAIALCLIEWGGADSQHTVVDWTVIRDRASAERFAEALMAAPRLARGYNSISGAIDYAAAKIFSNGIEAPRRVIDVSGDGPQIGGRPVQAARDDAVAAGIVINALVVKSAGGGYPGPRGEPLDQHYANDVIGGPGAFVMIADEETSFADALINKLIREIAGGPLEVATSGP